MEKRIKKAFETKFKVVYVLDWKYPIQVEKTKYRENEWYVVSKSESMDKFCHSQIFKTRKGAFTYMRDCIKVWEENKQRLNYAY